MSMRASCRPRLLARLILRLNWVSHEHPWRKSSPPGRSNGSGGGLFGGSGRLDMLGE